MCSAIQAFVCKKLIPAWGTLLHIYWKIPFWVSIWAWPPIHSKSFQPSELQCKHTSAKPLVQWTHNNVSNTATFWSAVYWVNTGKWCTKWEWNKLSYISQSDLSINMLQIGRQLDCGKKCSAETTYICACAALHCILTVRHMSRQLAAFHWLIFQVALIFY